METKEYLENRVHMIVVFWVTALCSDMERQCLGLVSKDPGATLPTIR